MPDTVQVMPFVTRLWMYASGVMFSIQHFTSGHPALTTILSLNPAAVYLSLDRNALLVGMPASPVTWLLGFAWAIGTLAVSYLYFWRGEEWYGNV